MDVAEVVGGVLGWWGVVLIEAGAPVDGGFGEGFAHVIVGAEGDGEVIGVGFALVGGDFDFEGVGFVFLDTDIEVDGAVGVVGAVVVVDDLVGGFREEDACVVVADGGFGQSEVVGPSAVGVEGDGLVDDFAAAWVFDDESGFWVFADGELVAAALACDSFEVDGVARFIDGAVGEEEALVGGVEGV